MPDPLPTPDIFPPFEGKLELRCRACKGSAAYAVGRIFLDPEAFQKPVPPDGSSGDIAAFTAYFHCVHCGAGGPWDLTASSMLTLMGLFFEFSQKPEAARFTFAKLQLFDGTCVHSATEAEAYLQARLEDDPDN